MAGPFYFAWVEATETTFGLSHQRFDEDVFAIEIDHQEGEFAAATIDLRNPKVGLLAAGRRQWAWLAWDGGASDGVVPLFFGRLVGIPQDLQAEAVRLEFLARPADWEARRAALGATLKVAPYWDPVFLEPARADDPDALLEARSALWHIDRVTHEVTISDILAGEEGTLDLGGEFFYDSLAVGYGQAPARRVRVAATVGWDQAAAGTVDLTKKLLKAARDAGSGDGNNIDSYTGDGLAKDWPKQGDSIGAGWKVGTSFVKRGNGKWKASESKRTVFANGLIADFPSWSFKPKFAVDYDVSRSRQEVLGFTLSADVQAVLADAADDEEILVTTSSQLVDQEVDPADTSSGFEMPIGDPRRRSYFQTTRGHQSIEYLIALARARLLSRARCVAIKLKTRWELGLGLSCRKSVSIADERLPGGAALGKVVGYVLTADGDSGRLECDIALACAVGKGNTITPSAGTPAWVEAGWVEDGWQAVAGASLSTAAGDVAWTPPDGQATPDDGVDFFAMTPRAVIESITVLGGKQEQAALLEAFLPDAQAAIDALNQDFTQITVTLVPLNGGPFETDYTIAVGDLMVPRMIDLEAA